MQQTAWNAPPVQEDLWTRADGLLCIPRRRRSSGSLPVVVQQADEADYDRRTCFQQRHQDMVYEPLYPTHSAECVSPVA